MPCISIQFDPGLGPILNVGVAAPATLRAAGPEAQPVVRVYPALVDTGADITCISPKVAEEGGLSPTGKRTMTSATETRDINTYLIDLALPFGEPRPGVAMAAQENLIVMEFDPGRPHYQVLLGRDIICAGLLNLVGYDKRFTFCL